MNELCVHKPTSFDKTHFSKANESINTFQYDATKKFSWLIPLRLITPLKQSNKDIVILTDTFTNYCIITI